MRLSTHLTHHDAMRAHPINHATDVLVDLEVTTSTPPLRGEPEDVSMGGKTWTGLGTNQGARARHHILSTTLLIQNYKSTYEHESRCTGPAGAGYGGSS